MPYDLSLPVVLKRAGWKVKIRDKERLEPPHATVINGCEYWRFDLREGKCMDDDPPPRRVPKELREIVKSNQPLLAKEWDLIHPKNKVEATDD